MRGRPYKAAGRVRAVALDFTLPPELRDLLDRVRAYVEEDALPAEAEVADPADLLSSWHVVERLRGRARERGLFTPPLPEARVRSCFAMTEPDVASSDPTNLEATAVRDGDEWVINGRKWCITGADGAAFAIVVARTGDDDAAGHRNYSLILVPTDTPGWRIVRHPEWMGSHLPGGHPEIELSDVRVPLENLLGGEGEGFVIAQKRLAGGRLAPALRWIGVSQRALDLTAQRLLERKAF